MIICCTVCIDFDPFGLNFQMGTAAYDFVRSFVSAHRETGRLLGSGVVCRVSGNRMALDYTDVLAPPVQLALDLMKEADRLEVPLRIGIDAGPVNPATDPVGQPCFLGLVSRRAELLASFSDPGQILVSGRVILVARGAVLPDAITGLGLLDLGPQFEEEEVYEIHYLESLPRTAITENELGKSPN